MMHGVVSPPHPSPQLPGESTVQDSQRGPPCHESRLPLHHAPQLLGALRTPAVPGRDMLSPWRRRSEALLPSQPLHCPFSSYNPHPEHTVCPLQGLSWSLPPATMAFLLLQQHRTPATSPTESKTPSTISSKTLALGEPDLARAHHPLPAWGKVGMEGMGGGRRKREQTLSPQTSKSTSAGAFGTV